MDNLIINILSGFLGILFGALVGFWVGIVTERHKQIVSKLIELKIEIIPVVNNLMKESNLSAIPYENLALINRFLLPDYEKLKVIVTGRKLKKLNSKWEAIFNVTMTETEKAGYSKSHLTSTWTREELNRLKEIQDAFILRLGVFKKVVESL